MRKRQASRMALMFVVLGNLRAVALLDVKCPNVKK